MKPGWKTSEFWVTLAVAVCGLLGSAGVLVEGSHLARVVGLAVAGLSAMGYTTVRGSVKKMEVVKNASPPTDS